jgi:hypothetical protein
MPDCVVPVCRRETQEKMNQRKPLHSADLPDWLIQLARQIGRDCGRSGTYTITIVVPDHSRAPRVVDISRVEGIRKMEIKERK